MNIPNELKYYTNHLWFLIEDDEITVGITDFAQENMGDILFVDLPAAGDTFSAEEVFTELESSKSTQEITMPFDFEVLSVNEELDDSPELINEDAYKNYILKIKADSDLDMLLDAGKYEELCESEAE
ncbi:MAG: glycine cleavage system protein H [Anaerofustis stercorihominis]|nr:glycine cleavage system protein H [Anaerofustis stercorihominis]